MEPDGLGLWSESFALGDFRVDRDQHGSTTIDIKSLQAAIGSPIAAVRTKNQVNCTFCRDWSECEDAIGEAYATFDHACMRYHFQCRCHRDCEFAFQILECKHPARTSQARF